MTISTFEFQVQHAFTIMLVSGSWLWDTGRSPTCWVQKHTAASVEDSLHSFIATLKDQINYSSYQWLTLVLSTLSCRIPPFSWNGYFRLEVFSTTLSSLRISHTVLLGVHYCPSLLHSGPRLYDSVFTTKNQIGHLATAHRHQLRFGKGSSRDVSDLDDKRARQGKHKRQH